MKKTEFVSSHDDIQRFVDQSDLNEYKKILKDEPKRIISNDKKKLSKSVLPGYFIESILGSQMTIKCKCPHCHEISVIKVNKEDYHPHSKENIEPYNECNLKCEHCNKEDKYVEVVLTDDNRTLVSYSLPYYYSLAKDNHLVITYYKLINLYDSKTYEFIHNKILFKKGCIITPFTIYYFKSNGTFEDYNNIIIPSFHNSYTPIYENIITKQQILDTINNSTVSRMGIQEAMGLIKGQEEKQITNFLDPFNGNSYINIVQKNSDFEKLVKAFKGHITTNDCKEHYAYINHCGFNVFSDYISSPKQHDSFEKTFGLTKRVVKYASKNNISFIMAKMIAYFQIIDPSVSEEQCCQFLKFLCHKQDNQENNIDFYFDRIKNAIAEIHKNAPKVKIRELIKYIIKCKNEQCILPRDALSTYRDYLSMAVALNYNMNEKSTLYPVSLEKDHDVAIHLTNILKEKTENLKLQNFSQTYYNQYFYENDELQTVIPDCTQDIIREGRQQNHCVATYVGKVVKGKCVIIFIRKKSNLKVSYYTVEINPSNNFIVQIRGFNNQLPTEKDIVNFIKQWKKAKNLVS